MPSNYILLERIELNASAASVVFANIPQSGYTDLKIVVSARDSDTSGALTQVSFNGVTTNLSSRRLRGTGSAATSTAFASNIYTQGQANGDTANTFGNSEIYIPNYTSSNYKSVSEDGVSENNATAAYMQLTAGLWSSTAAITSVTLTSAAGPYLQYSTFSLYGLAAVGTTPVIAPKATGGNLIENDGTYWIHTFTSTGTFTPLQGLTCDALVVAGGGGGGGSASAFRQGGGGGAGGYLTGSALSVAAQAYTITVGAGGAGVTGSTNTSGGSGSNSVFSSITSAGGGGGGGGDINGVAGGSGGGGGDGTGATRTGGAASPSGQGFAGGDGEGNNGGGGGGGASQVGEKGGVDGSLFGGDGGDGLASSITGTSITRAGGGGGGGRSGASTGGAGGGGNGARSEGVPSSSTAGTVNTGGGGGGGSGTGSLGDGAAGGSGIVIIRYAMA